MWEVSHAGGVARGGGSAVTIGSVRQHDDHVPSTVWTKDHPYLALRSSLTAQGWAKTDEASDSAEKDGDEEGDEGKRPKRMTGNFVQQTGREPESREKMSKRATR